MVLEVASLGLSFPICKMERVMLVSLEHVGGKIPGIGQEPFTSITGSGVGWEWVLSKVRGSWPVQ